MTHETGGAPARTIWQEGREPGGAVVAFGIAFALTVAVVDRWIAGEVGILFDLCFVMLCVAVALAVRPGEFFTVGVLPPLLLVVVLVLVALGHPDAIATQGDGVVRAVVTGLARHSWALIIGYPLCLACLGVRRRFDPTPA